MQTLIYRKRLMRFCCHASHLEEAVSPHYPSLKMKRNQCFQWISFKDKSCFGMKHLPSIIVNKQRDTMTIEGSGERREHESFQLHLALQSLNFNTWQGIKVELEFICHIHLMYSGFCLSTRLGDISLTSSSQFWLARQ